MNVLDFKKNLKYLDILSVTMCQEGGDGTEQHGCTRILHLGAAYLA